MIGILIVTHGDFAKGIVDGMELICGAQEQLETMGLRLSDNVDVFAETVLSKAKALDQGEGVLILVDFMSGSPSNVVCRFLLEEENMEAVAGVNFPMLLEAVNSRDCMDLRDLAKTCRDFGAMGIANVRETLIEQLSLQEDED